MKPIDRIIDFYARHGTIDEFFSDAIRCQNLGGEVISNEDFFLMGFPYASGWFVAAAAGNLKMAIDRLPSVSFAYFRRVSKGDSKSTPPRRYSINRLKKLGGIQWDS